MEPFYLPQQIINLPHDPLSPLNSDGDGELYLWACGAERNRNHARKSDSRVPESGPKATGRQCLSCGTEPTCRIPVPSDLFGELDQRLEKRSHRVRDLRAIQHQDRCAVRAVRGIREVTWTTVRCPAA